MYNPVKSVLLAALLLAACLPLASCEHTSSKPDAPVFAVDPIDIENASYIDALKGGADLNGDGVRNPADDQYGFFDSDWFGPIEIMYTGGQKIYDKNDEGKLELTLFNNKTVDIFSEYFNLMKNESCFLRLSDISEYIGNLFSYRA